jgi:hypothetical protein
VHGKSIQANSNFSSRQPTSRMASKPFQSGVQCCNVGSGLAVHPIDQPEHTVTLDLFSAGQCAQWTVSCEENPISVSGKC